MVTALPVQLRRGGLSTASWSVRLSAALHGSRPSPLVLAGVGAAASFALVIASGRAAVPLGVTLEPSLRGLLLPSTTGGTGSAVVVLLALAMLVSCWWALVDAAVRGKVSLRTVALVGAAWALPILIGPPLLSLDGYAYLAQGEMVARGLDPYSGGPVLLGADVAAGRVDPMWRSAPVPYGPVALVLFRAVALTTGGLTAGVLMLRLLAVLGVAAAVFVALRLSPPGRAPQVLALTALNPVTLVHLIGGVHLDAVLAGLTAMSLLALVRKRLWLAYGLAAIAVAVKVTALPLLPFVLVALWRSGEPRRRLLGRAAALTALPFVITLPVLHRPWGFLAALGVPGGSPPWYAPATLLGQGLGALGRLLLLPVHSAGLPSAGKFAALLLGATTVLLLVVAELRDDSGHTGHRTMWRAACALLVAALCLPALYAWYLAAGLFVLAATGGRQTRVALLAMSGGLTFCSLPPLYGSARWPLALAALAALALLSWQAVVLLRRPVDRQPVRAREPDAVRPARVLSVAGPRAPARPSPRPRHSHRRRTRTAGVALLAVSVVGLVGSSADADSGATVRRQAPERQRLVLQLKAQYPTLQVVGIELTADLGQRYVVEMVAPGEGTCQILLVSPGPASIPVRVSPGTRDTPRATDGRTCPSPL